MLRSPFPESIAWLLIFRWAATFPQTLSNIVLAIKNSPAWREGRDAIVVLRAKDDCRISPTVNRVPTVVHTSYGPHGLKSNRFYPHFSRLKSLEFGFRLSCLNRACDASTDIMFDLFTALCSETKRKTPGQLPGVFFANDVSRLTCPGDSYR